MAWHLDPHRHLGFRCVRDVGVPPVRGTPLLEPREAAGDAVPCNRQRLHDSNVEEEEQTHRRKDEYASKEEDDGDNRRVEADRVEQSFVYPATEKLIPQRPKLEEVEKARQ